MSLSRAQIEQIKKFIHSRGFTHIEVEMEILDHVASSVEEMLKQDPSKSLDKAIREVHSGFGVMGFSVMEDEFRKSFAKISRDKLVDIIYEYIATKKAIVTLGIFASFLLISEALLPFQTGVQYKLYFYALGIIEAIILAIGLYSGGRKWRKRSFVFTHYGVYAAFSFTLFGQGFGILTDLYYQSGTLLPILLFCLFSTLTVFYGIIFFEMMRWGYHWTNERYLKYAK